MKVRQHRGSLEESMATIEEIEPTREAVIAFLQRTDPFFDLRASHDVRVVPYRFDPRIGWDTHIILAGGYPAGWTDGPIP